MKRNTTKHSNPFLLLFMVVFAFAPAANAQEKKEAPTPQVLYNDILFRDSVLFEAYNTQNMGVFKSFFSADLEWFQDNGGLLTYETVFKNFDSNFKKPYKLTRTLVPGSLEVHPIKDYGAIEIGVHRFTHIENGKEEIGIFKFMMIWQFKNGQWNITKVISYDH
jgi:hypothetical protein